MMLDEIEACVRLMQRHGVAEFNLCRGEEVLTLRAATAAAARSVDVPVSDTRTVIKAAAAGVFRGAHPAVGERLVLGGGMVGPGQIVGFLQAGPCLRPVAGGTAGTLGATLAEEGALVGFGAELFELLADP